MKRIILFLAVLACLIASSCKKDQVVLPQDESQENPIFISITIDGVTSETIRTN